MKATQLPLIGSRRPLEIPLAPSGNVCEDVVSRRRGGRYMGRFDFDFPYEIRNMVLSATPNPDAANHRQRYFLKAGFPNVESDVWSDVGQGPHRVNGFAWKDYFEQRVGRRVVGVVWEELTIEGGNDFTREYPNGIILVVPAAVKTGPSLREQLEQLKADNLKLMSDNLELRAEISRMLGSNAMACEAPVAGCECAGCSYARSINESEPTP